MHGRWGRKLSLSLARFMFMRCDPSTTTYTRVCAVRAGQAGARAARACVLVVGDGHGLHGRHEAEGALLEADDARVVRRLALGEGQEAPRPQSPGR